MTQVSRSAFATNLASLITDNTSGDVSAADIRSILTDLEDSTTWYDEADIVNDTTPQLGGNLDVNGFSIVSTSNGNITLDPNGTGDVVLGTLTFDADQTVGASQDDYALVYDHSAGKIILAAQSGGGGGGATELADLTDVGSTTATNRNVLVADGNSWESRALTEADISDLGTYLEDITNESIGDLSDVTLSAAAQGDVLYRNATGWVNLGAGTSGQFLQTLGVGSNPQWATPAGSGNVSNTGTPVDNQIAVWTASTTIEGTSGLTYNGSALSVTGSIAVSGTVDGRDVAADGTKLDNIEALADVTDATNVETAIEAITLTAVTAATGDEFLIVDATDGGLKSVLYQSLPFLSNLVEDTSPQLGGNLDVNSNGITFAGATVTDVTGSDTLLVSGTAGATGDLAIWNVDGDLVDGPTPPSSAIAGISDTQTLTNKTMDADANQFTNLNIGNSEEVTWASITDVSDASAFTSGDKVLIFEAGVGMRKVDYDDLPSGGSGDAWSDAVDADIVPDGDGTRDVGSATNRFANVHTDSLDLNGTTFTGTTLADPGADRLLFWDDSESTVAYLTASTGLAISTTSLTVDVAALSHNVTSDADNYTLVIGDQNGIVVMSGGSANTLTIPTNASVAFPVGTKVEIWSTGAGTTSIAGDTGVTLQGNGGSASAGSCDIQTQYGGATLTKIATDTWMVGGDIDAVA